MVAKWSTLGLNGQHCATCEPAREGQTHSYRRPLGPPSQGSFHKVPGRVRLCLGPGQSVLRTSKWGRWCQTTGIFSHCYRHLFSPSSGSQVSEIPVSRATRALGSRGGASPVLPLPGLQAALARGCIITVSTTVLLWPSPYVSAASPLFPMSPVLGFRTLNPE